MAFSREYRVRELFLKRVEERFSKDRTLQFLKVLRDCEDRIRAHHSKITQVGRRSWREMMLNAYLYALFDAHSAGRRRVSPLREVARFTDHFTPSDNVDYALAQNGVSQAIKNCRISELLDEEDLQRMVQSISLLLAFFSSADNESPESIASELKEFMTRESSQILDAEAFEKRIRLFGQLLQTSVRDDASLVEAVRVSLQCLPSGEQRSSNLFLYLILKVFGLWRKVPLRLLHVPVDSDLIRVCNRIGLLARRLSNLEYGSVPYTAIQSISKRLVPDDPSAMYGLKYVAKVWCKPRSPNCFECPMSNVCDYAQNTES